MRFRQILISLSALPILVPLILMAFDLWISSITGSPLSITDSQFFYWMGFLFLYSAFLTICWVTYYLVKRTYYDF